MSFLNLISQIKHKTPPPSTNSPSRSGSVSRPKSTSSSNGSNKGRSHSSPPDTLVSDGIRPKAVDPAVQRLKELRRLEKEKKEQGVRAHQEAKRQANPKAKAQRKPGSSSSSSTANRSQSQITVNPNYIREQQEKQRRVGPPVKRLNFAELMREAQNKAKVIEIMKSDETNHSPKAFVSKTQVRKSELPLSSRSVIRPVSAVRSIDAVPAAALTRKAVNRALPSPVKPYVKPEPKPLAKPSAKLQAKLEAKKSTSSNKQDRSALPSQTQRSKPRRDAYEDDDEEGESELDDFVVDDEEEDGYYDDRSHSRIAPSHSSGDVGYDRDEIWKIMGRGRSRAQYMDDYDDDLSDMEATGADILKEEDRAAKRARQEDLEEQERERRRIEEKRRRLGKK